MYKNRNNTRLTPLAQKLRKNMTPEEEKLWYGFLKTLPFTVKRQKTIGKYIADFYIPQAKIVIEIDGAQHSGRVRGPVDLERDAYMSNLGILVLRYSNALIR